MGENTGKFWLTRAKHKRAYTLWECDDLDLRTHFQGDEERVLRGPYDSIKAARAAVSPKLVGGIGQPDLLDAQDDEGSTD